MRLLELYETISEKVRTSITELVDPQSPGFRQWFGKSRVVDERGRPQLVYHGTASRAEFTEVQPMTHFGTVDAAQTIINLRNVYGGGQRIYPAYLRIENPLEIEDTGEQHSTRRWLDTLESMGVFSTDDVTMLMDSWAEEGLINVGDDYWSDPEDYGYGENTFSPQHESRRFNDIAQVLQSRGYDGLHYVNEYEDAGSDSWVIFDPHQVKYVYAEAILYHGSPHRFSKLDPGKIGTGEGYQMFGYGLYFAEHPEVAQHYSQMGDNWAEYKGQRILYPWHRNDNIPSEIAIVGELMVSVAGDVKKAKLKLKNSDLPRYMPKVARKVWDNFEKLASQIEFKSTSHIYTVEVPDEKIAKTIDWDAPFSQQSYPYGQIVDALLRMPIQEDQLEDFDVDNTQGFIRRYLDPHEVDGQYAIGTLEDFLRLNDERIAKWFVSIGIPGIRYLDEESRRVGQGTRNLVLFDVRGAKVLGVKTPIGQETPIKEQRQKGRSLPETGYKDRFARIYRAVLATENQFKPMDYVTMSRKFAIEHADHLAATEEENAHVLSALVESKNVYEAYNPGEYFYDGPPVKTRIIYKAPAVTTEIVHGTTPNVGDNYEQEVGATWEQPDKPYGWS